MATSLAVTAATAVASVGINFGFDKSGGILNGTFGSGMGQVALNAGLAGAKTLTTSTINSAVNAVQFDGSGLTWNRDVFDAGFKAGLVSSAVSMTGAFASGALGQLNLGAKLEKVLGFNEGQIGEMQKFNSLVGNLTGAGVNYAMTGEATLNVLNLSDLTGGKLNLGLLELHLGGENGVSMSIGTGGTDISLGTVATAMAGLSHWGKNIEIEAAAKRNEMANVATGLRGLYGFGDETDKAELESILSGKTKLIAGGAGTGAQTETVNGQRYITLNGVNEADTAEKKLALALVLSHEGRRDGVVDENNQAETRSAVWAHTEIALRMLGDKATSSVMMSAINGNENLRRDLNAYATAKMNGDDTIFDKYVDSAYDSSADYWRIIKDADGKVVNVLDDGDREHATVVDHNGVVEKIVELNGSSLKTQLAGIVGNGMSPIDMNQIMMDSGLWWSEEEKKWYAREDRGIYKPPESTAPAATETDANGNWLANAWGTVTGAVSSWLDTKKTQATNFGTSVKDTVLDWLGIQKKAPEQLETPKEMEKPALLTRKQLNQGMLERAYGLDEYSACVLTSVAWLNYAYQSDEGNVMTAAEIINKLKDQEGVLYDSDGRVRTLNGIGGTLFGQNGLVYAEVDFTSKKALEEAGYTYYLETRERTDKIKEGTHTMAWANGVLFDPDDSSSTRWWENKETSDLTRYRPFKVRDVKK